MNSGECNGCGAQLTTGDMNNLCSLCSGRDVINVPLIHPTFVPPIQYSSVGWLCPRCGTIHAPHVEKCDCPPPTITTTGT